MMNFLKKQINKIIIWILIIVVLFLIGLIFKIPISILISTLSFVTSIFIGFLGKTWLEDYKIELNMELEKNKNELNKELEKYKTKLSGYSLVTKLQYDLEFKIYTELTKLIIEYTTAGNELRYCLYLYFSKKQQSFSLDYEIMVSNYTEKRRSLASFTLKHSPFFQKEIFNFLEKDFFILSSTLYEDCIEQLEKIIRGLECDVVFKENELKKIDKKQEQLFDKIRERIENMKIIED